MKPENQGFSFIDQFSKVKGKSVAFPPAKKINFFKNASFYFFKYSEHTSIHGLKFLGERRRSWIERLWWSVFLTTSLYFCATLIWKAYQKWERSPVIVSFATSETPISHIPFPAVTICPQIKAVKEKFDFSGVGVQKNNGTEISSVKDKHYSYMFLVCSDKQTLLVDIGKKVTMVADGGVIRYLMKVQPVFNENLLCYFGGFLCTYFYQPFTPIITSEGICYTFNMLDRDEVFTSNMEKSYYEYFSIEHQPPSQWTLEKGYSNNSILGVFPHRSVASGEDGGLTLIIKANDDDLDYVCGYGLQGYKVILHHPAQMPNAKKGFFRVGLNQYVTAAVKPSMMTTSKELEDYDPETRKCYFVVERSLRFFKTYNQQDCMLECFANFTYRYCHCVEFFMPRDNSTQICGPHDGLCVLEATNKFLVKDVNLDLNFLGASHRSREIFNEDPVVDCNCLPSCHSLDFEADVSQVAWNWREGERIINPKHDTKGYHSTKLQIFFKDTQFITSERHELYGMSDFLANCGGLLGLFTGFSFISLIEILYFITLRLICNLRKYGKHGWSETEGTKF